MRIRIAEDAAGAHNIHELYQLCSERCGKVRGALTFVMLISQLIEEKGGALRVFDKDLTKSVREPDNKNRVREKSVRNSKRKLPLSQNVEIKNIEQNEKPDAEVGKEDFDEKVSDPISFLSAIAEAKF